MLHKESKGPPGWAREGKKISGSLEIAQKWSIWEYNLVSFVASANFSSLKKQSGSTFLEVAQPVFYEFSVSFRLSPGMHGAITFLIISELEVGQTESSCNDRKLLYTLSLPLLTPCCKVFHWRNAV